MRNEKGITLAAVVVMLCCMGAVHASNQTARSNVLINLVVVDAYPSFCEERSSEKLEAPEQNTSCCVHVDVVNQIEIEELHNLPPPANLIR
ncbi:MAG: hypothetical protein ACI9JK_001176 [Phycisphaerales bacterium]|jgi:hypothetical protein